MDHNNVIFSEFISTGISFDYAHIYLWNGNKATATTAADTFIIVACKTSHTIINAENIVITAEL